MKAYKINKKFFKVLKNLKIDLIEVNWKIFRFKTILNFVGKIF